MKYTLLSLLTIATLFAQAQRANITNVEVGGWGGTANYYGDLNEGYSFKSVRPAAGAFFRYNAGDYFAFRSTFSYASLTFNDANITKKPYQQARNLSFFTHVFELAVGGEIHFKKFRFNDEDHRWAPYFNTGLNAFIVEPLARYNGNTFRLRDLGTEGQNQSDFTQRKKYSKLQFALPMGMGIKYRFNKVWVIGGELVYRKTFTDYIDDVSTTFVDDFILEYVPDGDIDVSNTVTLADRSVEVGDKVGVHGKQRGNSNTNDSYLFIGVTLAYTINKIKCPK